MPMCRSITQAVFLSFFFSNLSFSQGPNKPIVGIYSSNHRISDSSNFENKLYPAQYEKQVLIALSGYDELRNAHIEVKFKRVSSTMMARPGPLFIFRYRAKRRYKVYINSNAKKMRGASLEKVSFNGQVGVMAHEFAHILYYSKKGSWAIVSDGIKYVLSKKFRSKFEKQTDLVTLNKGFGWQMYDFADYIINKADVSEKYKAYKLKIYYSPGDIIDLLHNSDLYPTKLKEQ